VHESSDWLILPYELSGLSIDELHAHKPELAGIIDRLKPFIHARDSKPAA
jgi:hypothetical protein